MYYKIKLLSPVMVLPTFLKKQTVTTAFKNSVITPISETDKSYHRLYILFI